MPLLEKDGGVIVVQTENPKFGPSIEKPVETINLWDDCRGWSDDSGGVVPGTYSPKLFNFLMKVGYFCQKFHST